MSRKLSQEETKAALKEALKEWLDEKYLAVGKWAIGLITMSILGAVTYFILWANGFSKNH